MTNHTNHSHPNTKAARAACRKAQAQPMTSAEFLNLVEVASEAPTGRLLGELNTGDTFLDPIHTTDVLRVVGSEFGYTKYQPAHLALPIGLNGIFTEYPNELFVLLP